MSSGIPDVDEAVDFDRGAAADAWASFVDGNSYVPATVREVVFASWQRSRDLGIPARGQHAAVIEDATALANRIATNRELLIAAEHTWQLLAESFMASDNVLIVADASGVILEVRGNGEFVRAAAKQQVVPGRDWSEQSCGTNAIGTAVEIGGPVIIRSVEHYCESAKIWDCAASPVRDLTDGSLLGVLDVTSIGDLSDSHTLALAITAAHQVEYTLHSRELARSVQLLNWHRAAAQPWRNRAVLLLDRNGRIVRANEAARPFLAEHALVFRLHEDRPVLDDNQPARVLETLGYELPADLRESSTSREWHGGLVVIDTRATSDVTRSRDRGHAATREIHPAFRRIVTADPGLLDLMRRAERMAQANSAILLNGETGSGKELFARAIHECSGVATGPFVAVNCGTLTRELAASELLGYEAGAFTGAATKGRAGKFELADGGTLFLDEIGELPPDVQVNLLRVLQDNVVVRIGGNNERRVDVRIIAATHRDLERDAEDGRFRTDLLFRLRILVLDLPPLRERRDDIPLLVHHTLQLMQATYGLGARHVSQDLMSILAGHSWPGNVRELRGLIESTYILSDRPLLTPSDLPESFARPGASVPATDLRVASSPGREVGERAVILDAISLCAHNMTRVAAHLGISRSTLYRKMKRYGIERPALGETANPSGRVER